AYNAHQKEFITLLESPKKNPPVCLTAAKLIIRKPGNDIGKVLLVVTGTNGYITICNLLPYLETVRLTPGSNRTLNFGSSWDELKGTTSTNPVQIPEGYAVMWKQALHQNSIKSIEIAAPVEYGNNSD